MSLKISLIFILAFFIGCGPKVFTDGSYDDPKRVELLDDRFNEADMQAMSDAVTSTLVSCPILKNRVSIPVVILERLKNRTEEHIDMDSLGDKFRVSLMKTQKFRFIAKEQRDVLEEEYRYNQSGAVQNKTQKLRGKQIGADYLLSGMLSTNVQEVGDDKFVYYKLTVHLTDLETSLIECTEEKEVRKKFEKQRI